MALIASGDDCALAAGAAVAEGAAATEAPSEADAVEVAAGREVGRPAPRVGAMIGGGAGWQLVSKASARMAAWTENGDRMRNLR